MGTEVVLKAEQLCDEVHREFPKGAFFLVKFVFDQEKLYCRFPALRHGLCDSTTVAAKRCSNDLPAK